MSLRVELSKKLTSDHHHLCNSILRRITHSHPYQMILVTIYCFLEKNTYSVILLSDLHTLTTKDCTVKQHNEKK